MTTKLYDAILAYAQTEAIAGFWPQVAGILNTPRVIRQHTRGVTYALIRTILGDESRAIVANTLRDSQSGELRDAHLVLLNESTGLDLSSDARQTMLDQVGAAAQWPQELIDGLKAMGVTRQAPAAAYGFGAVTEEECQAAWTQYLFEQEWAGLRESQLWPAIEQGRDATVAALRAIADELEA